MRWLVENLPNQTITIEEVVKRAYEEEDLEKAAGIFGLAVLSAVWLFHQPEPGKIRKL
ncbi:MAG: hypothetical protein QXR17_01830 [Candidatus Bathyarchaeia archaeon]